MAFKRTFCCHIHPCSIRFWMRLLVPEPISPLLRWSSPWVFSAWPRSPWVPQLGPGWRPNICRSEAGFRGAGAGWLGPPWNFVMILMTSKLEIMFLNVFDVSLDGLNMLKRLTRNLDVFVWNKWSKVLELIWKNTCKGMSCSTFDLENRENFFSYLLKPSFSPATSLQWSLQQYPLKKLCRGKGFGSSTVPQVTSSLALKWLLLQLFHEHIWHFSHWASRRWANCIAFCTCPNGRAEIICAAGVDVPWTSLNLFLVKFFLSCFGAPLIWKNRWH